MGSEPVTANPIALLEHATWLRRLARSLVGDGAAEDLVQETWVAALRHPPDTDRPLRPWLRRVLSNAARLRWRGDANRVAREHALAAVTEVETPSSDELLERHEAQRLLARLVTELEEPYRTTVLLCYGEGLAPAEIARRLGVPGGTVRWRLKVGLDRLRDRLDEIHRGDRRAWLVVLGPLARGAGAAAPAKTSPIAALVAIAAVAVVVFAVLVLVARARSGDDAMGVHGPARGAVGASVMDGDGGRRDAMAGEDTVDVVQQLAGDHPPGWMAQEGAPPRRIAGHVVDEGRPAAGVLVRLTSELSRGGLIPALERRTGPDGRFDFGVQVAHEVTVSAAADARLAAIRHVDLRDPSPRVAPDALELVLLPCVVGYHGKVLDAGGSGIGHARLLREDTIGTESDAAGDYELCLLPTAAQLEQLRLVVRADGYGSVVIEAAPSGRIRRDIVLTPEAVVSGRALTEAGTPVASARIWIEPDVDGRRPPDQQSATLATVTDADGRFRLAGVHGGRHRLGGAALGTTARMQIVVVAAGGSADVVVPMVATARVRGVVMRSGQPVAGARVAIRDVPSDTAVSQRDGSFVLDRVPAGEVNVTAAPYAVRTPSPLIVKAGTEVEVILDVEAMARIEGTVRRHGQPVPFARVGFNGPTRIGTHADIAGHYFVEGLRPGSYGYLADDTRRGAFVMGRGLDLGDGEERVLDLELTSGARVTGIVVDARGEPVAGGFVRLRAASGDEGRCVTSATGVFDCAAMEGGGEYVPSVHAGDDASVPYPFVGGAPAPVVLADGDARVDGVRIAIDPRRLTIRGTVADGAGAPIGDARVQAWGAGGRRDRWTPAPTAVTDVDGGFEISSLAPGRYSLEVATLDGSRSALREVAAGAEPVDLVVERPVCTEAARASRVRVEPDRIRSRPPGRVIWGDRIELLGWDVPATVRRGQPVELTLYYRTLAPIDRPWWIFMHFDGERARHLADHEPVEGVCPTSAWEPGDIVIDRFTTTFDAAWMPAGQVTLWVGFFTGWAPTWRNFEVSEAPAGMQDVHGRIRLGHVTVE